LEDLNIARMIKNHTLAKSIADAAWNQLATYTRYKAASAGRTYLKLTHAVRRNAVAAVGCG
jgi:putative transposase